MSIANLNLIVIVVDGLHAGMIGAYGNSWIRTRRIDQLAVESFVLDQAFATRPDLPGAYRAMWFGESVTQRAVPESAESSLPALLAEAGLHTTLLTDEPEILRLAPPNAFPETIAIEPTACQPVAEVAGMQFAKLCQTASEWISAAPPTPFALWIHSRGLMAPWDAPYEFRARYAEEDDPPPPEFTAVPELLLPADYDPDLLLGITHAYAGQVTAIDQCLGWIVDQLGQSQLADTTLVTLISARGFPLGEHLRVGRCDEALYNELTQLVWLMRFPDGLGKLDRTQSLAQASDLPGTLLDGLRIDRARLGPTDSSLLPLLRGDHVTWRDHLRLYSQHDRGLRTPAWYLRQPATGAEELYAKPSDRWEVNEVGRLLPDVVSGLQAALAVPEQPPSISTFEPLPSLLTTEVD